MASAQSTDSSDSLSNLFQRNWRARSLDKAIAAIDPIQLCAEYTALRRRAPRRWLAGKQYFVGHSGVPSTTRDSNRREEHSAIALVNLGRRWALPDGGWFRLLDYQVPLKARQADSRIGKIDLLGITDRGRLMVIELKVAGANGSRADAPPLALMEGYVTPPSWRPTSRSLLVRRGAASASRLRGYRPSCSCWHPRVGGGAGWNCGLPATGGRLLPV